MAVRDPRDAAKLDAVDVDLLRRHHKAAVRRGVMGASMRVGLIRLVRVLSMPVEWPAVP